MAQLTLVTGPAFSGKSAHVRTLLPETIRMLVIATAQLGEDEDLQRRVAAYRSDRPEMWSTIEAPWQVSQVLGLCGYQYGGFWVNCIPEYLNNFVRRVGDTWTDAQILVEIDRIVGAAELAQGQVVIETREPAGVVPTDDVAGRRLNSLIGQANQRLSKAADEVLKLAAGVVTKIK